MKGAYVVVFTVRETVTIEVGAQGEVEFSIGEYGYVGSANGQGGLESRVGRHLETDSGETDNLFWHIDYILSNDAVSVSSVYVSQKLAECEIASLLQEERSRPVGSLGASDCSCESHILRGDVTGSCRDSGLERFES